ncbi:actin [Nitzschia inconspicua]|uniref:Actin n=1 Tax=Nitzschia inconspicua TaxID=303405 RepID=A0A9K3L4U7_9STRA|nr:actin [Nitzschia inconspicua]
MAGDGASITRSSASTIRRTTRFVSSRSGSRSFAIEPAPIILEFGSTIVRVGYAEQFQPQHLIALEDSIFDHDDNNKPKTKTNVTKTESQWYLVLAPTMEQIYDRLMCKPSTRRVVCVYKPYAPVAFQKALTQHLWNLGVPAQVHVDSLQVVPIAQGWKRGLIVHVSREEAMCACYANGYIIPSTIQIVPTGYKALLHGKVNETTGKTTYTVPSSPSELDSVMEEKLLNEHDPGSLVVALLMCFQECPLDLRAQIVSNVVFCGDGVVLLPDLPRRVVKKVEQLLERTQEEGSLEPSAPSSATPSATGNPVYAMIPVNWSSLRPLAARLTLKSCAPHRADWISWVGASLWAATWNKYDEDETPIPWIFLPSNKAETTL